DLLRRVLCNAEALLRAIACGCLEPGLVECNLEGNLPSTYRDRRLPPLPTGECDQHGERARRRPRQPERAALLAYLLRQQVLFGGTVDAGSEVGTEFEKLGVARVGAVAIGAQVHPFRLAEEAVLEPWRQRDAHRTPKIAMLADRGIPRQLTVGERD